MLISTNLDKCVWDFFFFLTAFATFCKFETISKIKICTNCIDNLIFHLWLI